MAGHTLDKTLMINCSVHCAAAFVNISVSAVIGRLVAWLEGEEEEERRMYSMWTSEEVRFTAPSLRP